MLKAVGMQLILRLFHIFSMDIAEPLPTARDRSEYLLITIEPQKGWSILRAVGSQTSNVSVNVF